MAGKLIAQNRKARFNYELLDSFEAGIALTGNEVKSVKAGHVSIVEAYVKLRRTEAWLVNAHIKPYQNQADTDATRDRKLLLHKQELAKLVGTSEAKNQTIVPVRVYLSRGLVKIEIALGRGKKQHDKRASIKEREQRREAHRAVRESLS